MKRIALSAVALTSVALLAGMWAGPVPGATDTTATGGETDTPPKGPKIAGTWYSNVTIVDANGVVIPGVDITTLASYTFKGTITVSDTTDYGGHPLFTGWDSSGHGAWSMENDVLTSVILNLIFDGDGNHTGSARITVSQVFDPQNPNVSKGTWYVEVFDLGEDPLGPPRAPAGGGGIVSRRLVVGK